MTLEFAHETELTMGGGTGLGKSSALALAALGRRVLGAPIKSVDDARRVRLPDATASSDQGALDRRDFVTSRFSSANR